MKSFFTDFEAVKTLKPKSAAEVQEIIKKANKDKTPLVPVSSGCNLQDTHMPTVKGAVAVDKERCGHHAVRFAVIEIARAGAV